MGSAVMMLVVAPGFYYLLFIPLKISSIICGWSLCRGRKQRVLMVLGSAAIHIPTIDVAIVGEPTQMNLAVSEKAW
jgi:hypothetical protein